MSFFQCRRFQFFDLERVDRDLSIKENLKGYEIQCGASGRGRIFLGDSEGYVHSISRQLDALTLGRTHPNGIIQMQQMKQSAILATLGVDAPDVFCVKFWDENLLDIEASKSQLLLKKEIKLSRTVAPTCFAVHENLQLLCVGFSDGLLQLYRGEVTRNRNLKLRTLMFNGDHGKFTGLFFKALDLSVILFASSTQSVFSFDVTNKDREAKIQGDNPGCNLNCSCYTDGASEDHFIVGRSDAVYCYTHEGKGPCYGFDGDKHMLHYFRGYLLIITNISIENCSMTVFDCNNKFVAFSSNISMAEPIRVAAGEWGCLFLITSDGSVWQLKEKDWQTKMGVFYKKNHYDLAIKVAKSNNIDADGMADIFRLYGDHLYAKGDLDGAIRQYCKTVGKLEASYVVRQYLDASRIMNLLEYLEVVHSTGYATPDLTTLLLNCLTKLKLHDKIEHYVQDPSCHFLEPETAIQVFRRGGMSKQAYKLAEKHHLYGSALQILLEDIKDPSREEVYNILEKIVLDQNADAEAILKRFGNSLVHLVGQVDSRSDGWKKIVRLLCESPAKRDLVELFIGRKEILIPLLENICQEFQTNDGPLMNLLLEAYLIQWSASNMADEGESEGDSAVNEKILALLSKAPNCQSWDWARALFACKKAGYTRGEIIAYEKKGLHNDLLAIRYADAQKTPSSWTCFIETCRKYARSKPSLWKDAFYLITLPTNESSQNQEVSQCPEAIVEEILSKLLEENLMEPLPIIDRLCKTRIKLGSVRSFLTKVLDRKDIEEDEKTCKKLQEETSAVRRHIENIRNKPSLFQGSRCNACQQKLDFPSVHFLCLHSFHQQCFDSFAEDERQCPVCWSKNKNILGPELPEIKLNRAALDADFKMKLGTAKSNAFSVLADFFSKGIFRDEQVRQNHPSGSRKFVEKLKTYQPQVEEVKTEGRLRLKEGTKSGFSKPASVTVTSIESYLESVKPETESARDFGARMTATAPALSSSMPFPRVQVSGSGSVTQPAKSNIGSLKASQKSNEQKVIVESTTVHRSIAEAAASTTTRASTGKNMNPFEDEEDTSNPFLSSVPAQKSSNPFEEDDDYDSSLNPFAE
ncbi:unnamed protein product [Allacma fusca]|uniref:RING-type domain-containing protein n=1 Tax=Allacma fusca TaxID=39272 RepID=A0A8J2PBP1_9HEXA|nr:unnamed protein product [Allacma fusca]